MTILNINNTLDDYFKYDLLLISEESDLQYVIPINRWENANDFPYQLNDNTYNYKYSWFKDSIDLSSIPAGNYLLYIRARGKGYETKVLFRDIFFKELNNKFDKKIEIDGRGYLFRRNYLNKNIPLELFIRDDGLIATENPPTIDNMFNTFYKVELNEGKLNITGTSHNVGADYSTNKEITRKLILENTKTYVKTSFDIGYIDDGPYKVTLNVSDGFDKTRAWYKASIDLINLEIGKYTIYINTSNGSVNDYGELSDIFYRNLGSSMIINNKKYSLVLNEKARNSIEIIVEKSS